MPWTDDDENRTTPPPPFSMAALPPSVRMLIVHAWSDGNVEVYPVVAVAGTCRYDPDEPGGWSPPEYGRVAWCARHARFVELSDIHEWCNDPVYEVVCAPWSPDLDPEKLAPIKARLKARLREQEED
jgi:hypothetical protein